MPQVTEQGLAQVKEIESDNDDEDSSEEESVKDILSKKKNAV